MNFFENDKYKIPEGIKVHFKMENQSCWSGDNEGILNFIDGQWFVDTERSGRIGFDYYLSAYPNSVYPLKNEEQDKFKKKEEINEVLFTCGNRDCKCLTEKLGIHFFTTDQRKALEHSKENDSKMWVSEHSLKEIEGMYETIKKLEKANE